MYFSPLPCYFAPLRPKHHPQHPILDLEQHVTISTVLHCIHNKLPACSGSPTCSCTASILYIFCPCGPRHRIFWSPWLTGYLTYLRTDRLLQASHSENLPGEFCGGPSVTGQMLLHVRRFPRQCHSSDGLHSSVVNLPSTLYSLVTGSVVK